MTHKIIQTKNYLLVVDDSEIKVGDWYLRYNKSLMRCTELKLSFNEALNKEETIIKSKGCGDPYERSKDYIKKIIAHLPLNNSPILEGVDLLPPLEDDEVDKLAYKYNPVMKLDNDFIRAGFKAGYNKAKEKYNKNLIDWIDNISNSIFALQASQIELKMLEQFKNKVQSLQQPKIPFGFEREIKKTKGRLIMIPPCKHCIKPKTITNSQGINQWVGKYIFD